MSTMLQLIIPLLDEKLTKDDVREDIGFVDAYTYDKNRPWLDNCVFLVYDTEKNVKENYEREYRFSKHTNIVNTRVEQIGGKFYKIYAYSMDVNSDLNKIINERSKPHFIKSGLRIATFWNGLSDDLLNLLFTSNHRRISPDWRSVPEYDYRPEPPVWWA